MRKLLSFIIAIIGGCLLTINIYGLFQDIRSPSLTNLALIDQTDMRFSDDIMLSERDTKSQLKKSSSETNSQYVQRINTVIQQGLAHIKWGSITDTEKYNQLVPIWENYLLFFMGKYSGIPEYEKYHYANYNRSIKRGIGICGDASMVLSQVLNENNIKNNIISFSGQGHVIVQAYIENKEVLLDPDFGVVLDISLAETNKETELIEQEYSKKGYSPEEIDTLLLAYSLPQKSWRDTKHFITKKYYFEYLSYYIKWILPFLFFWVALFLYSKPFRNTGRMT